MYFSLSTFFIKNDEYLNNNVTYTKVSLNMINYISSWLYDKPSIIEKTLKLSLYKNMIIDLLAIDGHEYFITDRSELYIKTNNKYIKHDINIEFFRNRSVDIFYSTIMVDDILKIIGIQSESNNKITKIYLPTYYDFDLPGAIRTDKFRNMKLFYIFTKRSRIHFSEICEYIENPYKLITDNQITLFVIKKNMTIHKDRMLFGLFSCKQLIQYVVDDIYLQIKLFMCALFYPCYFS